MMNTTMNRIGRRQWIRLRLLGRRINDRLWKPAVRWIAYTRTVRTLRETDPHLLRDMGINRYRIGAYVDDMISADPSVSAALAGHGTTLYRFDNDNLTRKDDGRGYLDAA